MVLSVENNIKVYSNKSVYPQLSKGINFKSNTTSPLEKEPTSDVVEINSDEKTKQKKKENSKKYLLGLGAGFVAVVATGLCLMRRDANKVAKLYKDKLIKCNLSEHIDFKEAKTLEEGIKFAKEVLGIKEVKGFETINKEGALEAINFANKGIVDVSNANKGNLYIPSALSLEEIGESTLAYDVLDINSARFGQLGINKRYFTHEGLDKILKEKFNILEMAKDTTQKAKDSSSKRDINFGIKWSDRYKALLNRYKSNPQSLTIAEKRELDATYRETASAWSNAIKYNPISTLEKEVGLLNKNGITCDFEALSKLPIDEQIKKFDEVCLEFFNKTNTILGIESSQYIPCETIYHEMGHLQDFGKNLKNLHIKNTAWGRLKEAFKTRRKQDECLDNIQNRWAKKGDKGVKKLLEDSPDDFKMLYPDFYEHITDPEIQKTAGQVSSYAREGIGEFIADTYSGLISGKKYSDDVMKLYEKYNGPKLAGM